MRIFLISALTIFTVALVGVAVVFFYIQYKLNSHDNSPKNLPATETTDVSADPDSVTNGTADVTAPAAAPSLADTLVPEEGIPLSEVPLSDTQTTVLEGVGVDTNTFVITKEMANCAEAKLSTARMQEIIDGASPTFFETMSLSGCL